MVIVNTYPDALSTHRHIRIVQAMHYRLGHCFFQEHMSLTVVGADNLYFLHRVLRRILAEESK
jgi:hypothetical protein